MSSPELPAPATTAVEPAEAPALLAGFLYVLGATVLFASSALLVDQLSAVYHLSALEISTGRTVLVVPVLFLYIALRRAELFELEAREVPLYAASGLAICLSYVTWSFSVQINKPAVAVALGFSAPAFIALGDRFLFGTRLGPFQIGAIAVNLLGCALAARLGTPADLVRSPAGLLWGIGNAVVFSIYTLLGRSMARTGRREALSVLFYSFVFAALSVLVAGTEAEGTALFRLGLDFRGWVFLGGLALGPTLLAYAFYNYGLKAMPATFASVILTLEPALVAIFAYVLLGRTIQLSQAFGIALIIGAVAAMQLSVWRGRQPNSG